LLFYFCVVQPSLNTNSIIMSEEDRLLKLMNKKSEEAFEKARRDALAKYQNHGGKAGDFHLSEKEKEEKPKVRAQASFDRSETPAWKEEHERREKEEKLRDAEDSKKKANSDFIVI